MLIAQASHVRTRAPAASSSDDVTLEVNLPFRPAGATAPGSDDDARPLRDCDRAKLSAVAREPARCGVHHARLVESISKLP